MKKILVIVFVLLAGFLASGTVLESLHGSSFALVHVYHSPFFVVLWSVAVLADVFLLVSNGAWRRLPVFLLHGAFLLMFAGALSSWCGGIHSRVKLRPGEAVCSFMTEGKGLHEMPFCLRLGQFEVVNYPGTRTPMDFVSHVEVADFEGHSLKSADISMNHILRYRHYRFYQNDYDAEGNSVLEVAHDPWGIALTYSGFLLLLLGLLSMFFERQGAFRRLLGHPLLNRAGVIMLLLLSSLSIQAANPRVLPKGTASKMGEIYVLYNGRICPLQTLAQDFTVKLCGKSHYGGLTPEQVFSGFLFYYEDWINVPMLKIKDKQVREELGIAGKYACWSDFTDEYGKYRLDAALASGAKNSAEMKKYRAADEKCQLVQMLHNSRLLKIFPHADSLGGMSWYSQNDQLPLDIPDDEYIFIRKQLGYCQELVFKNDFRQLEQVFGKMRKYQVRQAAAVLPSQSAYRAERLYNRLDGGKWMAMLSITLGLVCFAFYMSRIGRGKAVPCAVRTAAGAWVVLLSLFLLLIYLLRWISGGHVPMAGSHDTMVLLALFTCLLTLCFFRRYQLAIPFGMLIAGFVMLVAMIGSGNPPVISLMPVLSSPLLSLHVTVIMIAYALLLFVMLNGLAGVVLAFGNKSHIVETGRLRLLSLLLLYPAVSLLVVGILIGAVWANISWGRYWSWDPKEVWAMLTALAYALPLHWKSFPLFRKPRFFHAYCVLAFLCVLVTYFGVNLILGGMHSYN